MKNLKMISEAFIADKQVKKSCDGSGNFEVKRELFISHNGGSS